MGTKTETKPKLVFFGNERLATGHVTSAPVLRMLVAAGYDVVAVVSNYSQSQSRKSRQLEIAEVARELGIPLLLPTKPSEIIEQLHDFKAVAGVLVAYGKIVPQSVIDIFPRGIVNIHPSLLPLHRGPTPIESVMLSGELETGVSLMQLSKAMDAGGVYAQVRYTLAEGLGLWPAKLTKQVLADTLLSMGGELLNKYLPAILEGSLLPAAQDEATATYDKLIKKSDGIVNLTLPAKQIERQIRAFAGWPGSSLEIAGRNVTVIKASLVADSGVPRTVTVVNGRLLVHGTYGALEIKRLKPAGKSEMEARAFLAGNKI